MRKGGGRKGVAGVAVLLLLVGAAMILPALPAGHAPGQAKEASVGAQLSGSPVEEFPIPLSNAGPLSIAQAPDGSFWLAEFSAGAIAQFIPSNQTFRQYPLPGTGHLPAYVTVDSKGMVWFSDQGGHGAIWMFDPNDRNFTEHLTPCGFSDPVGVQVDVSGNVWFAEDSCNALGELVYPGYSAVDYVFPEQQSGPAELAIQNKAGGEAVWVTESLGNRVAEFNVTAHSFQEFTTSAPFTSPVGIVIDGSGDVWVSEHGGSAIVRLVPQTGIFTFYPTSPPPGSAGYPNSAPATLVMDRQGRLWFVEHFSNKVGRLDPSTGELDEWEIPSAGVYSVLSALDKQGNFWFAEFTGDKVGTIAANSTVSVAVTPLGSPSSDSVSAGQTIVRDFEVRNGGGSTITINLNVTTTFRSDGYTTSAEAALNATSLVLPPGGMGFIRAEVTPDAGIAPGGYSVGMAAQAGNESSVGIVVLQVSLSPLDAFLYQSLPFVLFAVLVALLVGDGYLFVRIRRLSGRAMRPHSAEMVLAAVLCVVVSLVALSDGIQAVVAKCPGLPGLGTTSSPSNAIAITVLWSEIAGVGVLGFLFVKGYLTLRRLERKKGMRSGTR